MHLFRESGSLGASEEDEVSFFSEMDKENNKNRINIQETRNDTEANPALMAFTVTSFAGPPAIQPQVPALNLNSFGDRTPLKNANAKYGAIPRQTLQTLPSLPSDCSWGLTPKVEPPSAPKPQLAGMAIPKIQNEPRLPLVKPQNNFSMKPPPSFALNVQSKTENLHQNPVTNKTHRPISFQPFPSAINLKTENSEPPLSIQLFAPTGQKSINQANLAQVKPVSSVPLSLLERNDSSAKTQNGDKAAEKRALLERTETLKREVAKLTDKDKILRKKTISAALIGQTFDRKLDNLITALKTAPSTERED